ncbi:long-chain-fatty-acid--CoA ligase [Massilia forsythiae]|uniref:Long-chain-fatty-acid--CoA ligase n=1 Tax=Massilia forsythiae TaxID=2728020 RepID=A0A7Z2VW67_9BURK|nr:long-chain-fatty-acid--CoA ligase [Massilia forsythiae]QJE00270.1 long-chain-fatty-acid--CoA ligase [Massilia forsythiae]
MDKIWLKSYPPGVPADIDPDAYGSLVQLLEESFRKYAANQAFVCMDRFLTYAELDAMSARLAAWLQSRGLVPGARVAVMMPNVLQYPVALAAILRAGYTVVNVNPLYTARELEHQLTDSGSEAIVVLENFARTVQQVLGKTPVRHVVVASMGELLGGAKGMLVDFVVRSVKKLVPEFSIPQMVRFKDALAQGGKMPFTPARLASGDIAFLQYTGGTTGVAKGAALTHRNVIANVLQSEAWSKQAMSRPPLVEFPTIVCALPLYHIFALTACALWGMRVGALNLLIPNPRDIPGFVKELAKYRINMLPAVNTLYNALVNNPGFRHVDFSGLKVSNGGGMAVQRAVNDKWRAITGTSIIEGYGLSETSPVATCNRCDADFTGTIGLPVPSTEVAILDDDGNPLPLGRTGEIAIRGPQVMAGYWNRPDETAKVMTADGWFKSGDLGTMDEGGYVKIVDRKKDMILVSGFNVYPNELEEVIMAHPGVLECAVVGVPDAHSGEAVKVFVVRRDASLDADGLMAYCRSELTGYKRPKYIEFRDELPKTNVGKILRRALREERQPA